MEACPNELQRSRGIGPALILTPKPWVGEQDNAVDWVLSPCLVKDWRAQSSPNGQLPTASDCQFQVLNTFSCRGKFLPNLFFL